MRILPKALSLLCGLLLAGAAIGADPVPPAARWPAAVKSMMLGAAWAGERSVAVGERGVVLLTDPGQPPRQAREVPLSLTLTATSFVDARRGWAVGHGGAILASDDGGETWRVQRVDTDEDRPLLAVHFFDAQQGVAAGLWSLLLVTDNGGQDWTPVTLPTPPGAKRADLNLTALFADRQGRLYATGERGMVLRSDDRGRHWRYLPTGYKGSLWSGIAPGPDGVLVVGGQRGSVFRSEDGGAHWRPVTVEGKSSITGFAAAAGELRAVGLDGFQATSRDAGRSFSTEWLPGRPTLTAIQLGADGRQLLWGRTGLVTPAGPR